jgi:hypothetical protein
MHRHEGGGGRDRPKMIDNLLASAIYGSLPDEENGAMDQALGLRLIALRARVVANFNAGSWEELGLLTGLSRIIDGHPRLLRSLDWGDADYDGNALVVLREMVETDPRTLSIIEDYLNRTFPDETQYISAKPSERRITFAPNVFQVPDGLRVEPDLASVMMPFGKEFDPVYESIKRACRASVLRCLRVDDIWEHSTIVQDIFTLVFRSQVVVVDFSRKNPNVMYETGIAHTLGKHVVPISQSIDDVPFDLRHHRVLTYLPNSEGLASMEKALAVKLRTFSEAPPSAADPLTIPF